MVWSDRTQTWRNLRLLNALIGCALCVALLALYWTSFDHPLIFDDSLLEGKTFNDTFRSLIPIQPRAISYGSFVWLEEALGATLWTQRLFNVLIHALNMILLFLLYGALMRHIEWTPTISGEHSHSDATKSMGDVASNDAARQNAERWLAVALFAFNPVAVYAVAYLVQRSILLCTAASLVCLMCIVRASERRSVLVLIGAAIAYVVALFCKEYAVALPVVAAATWVVIARPPAVQLVRSSAVAAMLGLVGVAVLYSYYGGIVGKAFDDKSELYLRQLDGLAPGMREHAWALSIVNQAWLFFQYAGHWLWPDPSAMSIDLRPSFPINLWSVRSALGIAAYLGVAVFGFVLLLRYRNWRTLLGWCLIVAAALFLTEFSAVWIQDPFVLYRSYLWAIAFPGLILIGLFFFRRAPLALIAVIGIAVLVLFSYLAADRIGSMASNIKLWDDAVQKRPAALTVGQSRLFNNRGMAHLAAGDQSAALRDFNASARLGDGGEGFFNVATVMLANSRPAEAAQALDAANSRGMDTPAWQLKRGIAAAQLGQTDAAIKLLTTALSRAEAPGTLQGDLVPLILSHRALLFLGKNDLASARIDSNRALSANPSDANTQLAAGGVAMLEGNGEAALKYYANAYSLEASVAALFGQARALIKLGRTDTALRRLDEALTIDSSNELVRRLRSQLVAERK